MDLRLLPVSNFQHFLLNFHNVPLNFRNARNSHNVSSLYNVHQLLADRNIGQTLMFRYLLRIRTNLHMRNDEHSPHV